MTIAGFQSLSLLDYPGIISSIIFTQGCPFRCVYCHNPELIPIKPLDPQSCIDEERVIERLKQRLRMIEGVCITGGEPTMHPDLPKFIKKIKELGLLVKLDTNGVHPRMIAELLRDHLVDFIAMDIKHSWEKYAQIIGINQKNVIDQCRETCDLIQNSGIAHEFRTTVYPALHSIQDLQHIAGQLNEGTHYALQEIRYEKTFETQLSKTKKMDLREVSRLIAEQYPQLHIEVRTASPV